MQQNRTGEVKVQQGFVCRPIGSRTSDWVTDDSRRRRLATEAWATPDTRRGPAGKLQRRKRGLAEAIACRQRKPETRCDRPTRRHHNTNQPARITPELSRTAREPVWADAATKRFRLERLVMPLRPRMHPGSPHKTRRCRDVPWSCNDLGKALQVSLASSLAMLRLQRFSSMFPASAAVGQRRAHLSDLSQPP